MPRPAVIAVVLAVFVAAGCGGSGGGPAAPSGGADPGRTAAPATSGADPHPTPTPRPAEEAPGSAVVRAWADHLRAGRYDRADALFALPATVANGTAPLTLRTRAQVALFDRSLTCAARVIATRRARGGRLLATFVLLEHHGPVASCGSGVGHTAQVLLRVRGGRIREWLRVADPETAPALSL